MSVVLAALLARLLCVSCEATPQALPALPSKPVAATEVAAPFGDPRAGGRLDLETVLLAAARGAHDARGTSAQAGGALAVLLPDPAQVGPQRRLSLFLAQQKTAAARTTDSLDTAREEGLPSVEALVRLRTREDANFARRARRMGRHLQQTTNAAVEFAYPRTGAELLQALVATSRRGVIANLVVYGHAAPSSLYMLEDRGFYRSVAEVAARSPLVAELAVDREAALRVLGARDLSDLQKLVARGEVRFAKDAVIVFAGCAVAGESEIEPAGIGARMAEISGATVFASVNVTDQSMGPSGARLSEYSRGTWARFARGAKPVKLNARVLDAVARLASPETAGAIAAEAPAAAPPLQGLRQLECAFLEAIEARERRSCGLGAPPDVMAGHRPPGERDLAQR